MAIFCHATPLESGSIVGATDSHEHQDATTASAIDKLRDHDGTRNMSPLGSIIGAADGHENRNATTLTIDKPRDLPLPPNGGVRRSMGEHVPNSRFTPYPRVTPENRKPAYGLRRSSYTPEPLRIQKKRASHPGGTRTATPYVTNLETIDSQPSLHHFETDGQNGRYGSTSINGRKSGGFSSNNGVESGSMTRARRPSSHTELSGDIIANRRKGSVIEGDTLKEWTDIVEEEGWI